jgi:hypothetical protein
MDQVAQLTVIATVGDGPLEGRIHALTEQAPRLSAIRLEGVNAGWIDAGWAVPRFSANGAVRPFQRSKSDQTGFTNGKPGNSEQWETTDTAIGGKKREE